MVNMAELPKYEAYKESGVDWLGNVPAEWNLSPLKYIMSLISEKVHPSGSDLRYIGMENIESWTGKYIEAEQEAEGLANKFSPQDILFGKLRPYLAKVAIAKFPGICSAELLVYRARLGQAGYFKYLLGSNDFISLVNSSAYGI